MDWYIKILEVERIPGLPPCGYIYKAEIIGTPDVIHLGGLTYWLVTKKFEVGDIIKTGKLYRAAK